MKTIIKYIISSLLLSSALTIYAAGPALINDADGFTNIRSGPGLEHDVIYTLKADDFFYYKRDTSNGDWSKVLSWKGNQKEGYIHNSRIQLVTELSLGPQKGLITNVLEKYSMLIMERNAKDTSLKLKLMSNAERGNYSDSKYNPILDVLPNYFCATKDVEILKLFFDLLWTNRGSANEAPSFSVGECFICEPEFLLWQLSQIKLREKSEWILKDIEWGLMNIFYKKEDKAFERLMGMVKQELEKFEE